MAKVLSKEYIIESVLSYNKENDKVPTIKELGESYSIRRQDIEKTCGSYSKLLIELKLKTDISKLKDYRSEEFDEFYNEYISGKSYKELSKRYQISEYTVVRLIKESGRGYRNNRWTGEQLKILEELYPYAEWDVILVKLAPFNKDDIATKAYKLNIKRDCFGFNEEQERFLIENYEKYPIKKLSEMIGKTESSISSKANNLGLKRVEKWSDDEVSILIEKYPTHSAKELEKFLPKRHRNTITEKANMLGLKKSENYNYYDNAVSKKEELTKELIAFASELGRTPTSREITDNSTMSGIVTYHRYFGSYSNACKEAGLDVNSKLFGKSFHLESKNGDVCLSKREKEITDLLIDNNIDYEKEVLYKDIILDENMKNIRCDWLINGDVIVEYFGMPEKEYYKERMDEKISLCEEKGLKLIALDIKDLSWNYRGLIDKFKKLEIDLVV